MKTLSIKDARSKFSELIHLAEQGDESQITRYGEPVAKIVPVEQTRPVFPDLTSFHETFGLTSKEEVTLTDILLQMREEERS